MKRRIPITREVVVLIVLLVVLAGLSTFVAARQQQQVDETSNQFVTYSSHSAMPGGTLALYNWLNAIGYHAERIENSAFRVGDDVHFLFVLGPTDELTRNEALYLENWVERGNTLYVADDGFASNNGVLRELGVTMDLTTSNIGRLTLQQPLVNSSLGELTGDFYGTLVAQNSDYVRYAGAHTLSLIRFARGQGVIWVTSVPNLVTNAGLQNDNNAKFVLGLLGNLPRGSTVAFDEYHHGLNQGGENETFLFALYTTPWGWGLMFALLLGLAYLIVNGRRFGRTVPVLRTLARRTPSEYVVSMANLFRRANKRGMVLQHYRHALKRRLGRAYHLNPDMSDERYLEMLTKMRPELDRNELARILNNLRRAESSEMDLVTIVEQSVTFGRAKK